MDKVDIVLDCGSAGCRCGFSGDDSPPILFPSIVGRPKNPGIFVGMDPKDFFVGKEAIAKRGILILKYPLEYGVIVNWECMEKIYNHAFEELNVIPKKHRVVLTETPLNPMNCREKMTSIMFETFNVPELYVGSGAVFSLFASGRTTGTVLDSGDGITSIVPIYEGQSIHDAVVRMNIAGRDITEYLLKILYENGLLLSLFNYSLRRVDVNDIKHRLCYFARDYWAELNKRECGREYELPDGTKVTIYSQLFRAPEILFKPTDIGYKCLGIHKAVNNSILKCQEDVRKCMFENIVFTGGSTLFDGFGERLFEEIKKLAPTKYKNEIMVSSCLDKRFSSWIGASLASASLRDKWITFDEYDENGGSIIHRKCIMGSVTGIHMGVIGREKKEDTEERTEFLNNSELFVFKEKEFSEIFFGIKLLNKDIKNIFRSFL